MKFDVVIANGVLLSAEGETRADVAIRGETIAAVGPGLAAANTAAPRSSMRRDGKSFRVESMSTSISSFRSAARSPATTGTRAPARRRGEA